MYLCTHHHNDIVGKIRLPDRSSKALLTFNIKTTDFIYGVYQILQWLAAVVPPRYYISAMRKLMIMGVGITEVTQEVAVLSAMTVLFLAIALKKFNTRLE